MVDPWFKFYATDWRADPRLRMCSLAARGLWIDLMSYMHEGDPYGHLVIDGMTPDVDAISALVGRPSPEVKKALTELESKNVFSRTKSGGIFSRRMVRDKARAERDKANGKAGGNPKIKAAVEEEVNPPDKPADKAKTLEARIQSPEARNKNPPAGAQAPPPRATWSDPATELYRRGREILGANAGGMVKRLLEAKGGQVPLARAALEQASVKANPREYVGAILRKQATIDDESTAAFQLWKSGRDGFG